MLRQYLNRTVAGHKNQNDKLMWLKCSVTARDPFTFQEDVRFIVNVKFKSHQNTNLNVESVALFVAACKHHIQIKPLLLRSRHQRYRSLVCTMCSVTACS